MISRTVILLSLCSLAPALAKDVRMGIAYAPPVEAESDEVAIKAVHNAQAPAEASCTVKILERGKIKARGPTSSIEKISMEVCGQKSRYEIQRILMRADSVMVSAKRL